MISNILILLVVGIFLGILVPFLIYKNIIKVEGAPKKIMPSKFGIFIIGAIILNFLGCLFISDQVFGSIALGAGLSTVINVGIIYFFRNFENFKEKV